MSIGTGAAWRAETLNGSTGARDFYGPANAPAGIMFTQSRATVRTFATSRPEISMSSASIELTPPTAGSTSTPHLRTQPNVTCFGLELIAPAQPKDYRLGTSRERITTAFRRPATWRFTPSPLSISHRWLRW